MPMRCGEQKHLELCPVYTPAQAYDSFRVSDRGTTLHASDLQ